jgi:hypothetical protein
MDLLQLVNQIVQRDHDDVWSAMVPQHVSACPGLNFTQKTRWWTPRERGITYATLCDECYRKYRSEDDFSAVSTTNSCFCDGFLYGNRAGTQGPINLSFWNKELTRFYPVTADGVEIPQENGFYIAIHVKLEPGYVFNYELRVNGQVLVPYSEDYHYNITIVSNNEPAMFALKKYYIVPEDGWQRFPRDFLLHRGIIVSGSEIAVNIRVYKTVEKLFHTATGVFIGEYAYHNGVCVIRDTEANSHMDRLRTNHLSYSTMKTPFKSMEEVRILRAELRLRSSSAAGSGLMEESIMAYREAIAKRIRYLQVKGGESSEEEVARLRLALSAFNES